MMTWMGRLIWVPLALALVAFAVANRAPVVISLDPFAADMPAIGLEMPLWAALFGAALVGMISAGFVAWTVQARQALRRSARRRAQDKADKPAEPGHDLPIIAPEKPMPLMTPMTPAHLRSVDTPPPAAGSVTPASQA